MKARTGVGARAVLLGAPGGEDDGRAGVPEQTGGSHQLVDGHARDSLDPVGPVRRHRPANGLETGRAGADEVEVDQALLDGDVEQAVGQGHVGPGGGLEVQGRAARRRGGPGIDDDQATAPRPLLVEVLHDRRHGLGHVAAHQQDGVGVGEVLDGKGQTPVHTERLLAGGGRGRHAEPAVVVDLGRPEGDAGELAQQVGLLVGQAASPEHPDRREAEPLLAATDPGGHPRQRVVPRRRPERVGAPVADQGRGQPLGMVEQVGRGPALLAQAHPGWSGTPATAPVVVRSDRAPG